MGSKIAAGVAVAKWSTFTHGTWSTCYSKAMSQGQ